MSTSTDADEELSTTPDLAPSSSATRINQSETSSNLTTPSRPGTAPTLDDYTCPVCMDPLIDPVSTNCDHRFCIYCLANWFHLRGRKNCPTCRTTINHMEAQPTVAATIEQLVETQFTGEQKSEREETKRLRNESEVMQGLGSSPLETLISQTQRSNSRFDFDFPMFDLDDVDDLTSAGGNRLYVPDTFSQNPMINIYARAMYQSATLDDPNDWNATVARMIHPTTTLNPMPTYQATALGEITARLDDFEIALRESQMAYRYLMDGMTSLDSDGRYFEVIEQRFRSLGLVPENGRIVSTYPSSEGSDEQTPASRRSRRQPTDWYFIHENRARLERELRAEWLRQRSQAETAARDREGRRQIRQAEREIQHMLRAESVNSGGAESDPFESFGGGRERDRDRESNFFASMNDRIRRPPRRHQNRDRRRRSNRNRFPESYELPPGQVHAHGHAQGHVPVDNVFPTFEQTLFGNPYGNTQIFTAEQPYEYTETVRFPSVTTRNPENSVTTTNAQNICVVHPDGSETWVDVAQRLEHDNGYQVYVSRPEVTLTGNRGQAEGSTSSHALFLEETEEDEEGQDESALLHEASYEVEFVVQRQRCQQCGHGGHGGHLNGNYPGGTGL